MDPTFSAITQGAANPVLTQAPRPSPELASFGYHTTSPTPPATFQSALNQARLPAAQPESDDDRHKRAAEAAAGLVSAALILPLLKQLRRSPWGQNTIFSPGTGEKTFGPEFDMQLADRIAHSPRLAATRVLTDRLFNRGASAKKPQAALKGTDLHG